MDAEKLKARKQIKFFEIPLFEDDLHDSGVSILRVKIKVINAVQLFFFFLLL